MCGVLGAKELQIRVILRDKTCKKSNDYFARIASRIPEVAACIWPILRLSIGICHCDVHFEAVKSSMSVLLILFGGYLSNYDPVTSKMTVL